VAVKEWDDQVVFLHQIVPGAADKSYGIHVAQLAGVPRSVNERAREVLELLEAQHQAADGAGAKSSAVHTSALNGHAGRPSSHWQMTLFGFEEHPLLEEIRAADLEGVAADEALELVRDWQRRLTSELAPAKR
jgi:DNA mismatch repair protein MutS